MALREDTEGMKKALIVGATSAIAQETAKILAERGDRLFLVGRDEERLRAVMDDLTLRGAGQVGMEVLDVLDEAAHERAISQAAEAMGGLDLAILAHGLLPNQRDCEASVSLQREAIETNALSVLSMLIPLANRFERDGEGTIMVISSVAGDRGRKSNYVYGAAKGMVSLYLQGLRNRLHSSGVRVITVKPGFVDTPMTKAFKKGFLWAKPERIAAGMVRSLDRSRDLVYLPWYWRWIMLVVRMIPEPIFKRLSS
jgi:short-subunit dehydrogenase